MQPRFNWPWIRVTNALLQAVCKCLGPHAHALTVAAVVCPKFFHQMNDAAVRGCGRSCRSLRRKPLPAIWPHFTLVRCNNLGARKVSCIRFNNTTMRCSASTPLRCPRQAPAIAAPCVASHALLTPAAAPALAGPCSRCAGGGQAGRVSRAAAQGEPRACALIWRPHTAPHI